MRYGKIYKITNTINNKVYIGQTILDNPMHRWKEHYDAYKDKSKNTYLYRAMRYHGITNFVFQIIEKRIPYANINEREKYYIKQYKSNNPDYGYNLTLGGDTSYNSKYTEETIRKVIETIINNPNMSLTKIGKLFNMSAGLISDINCGDIWCFSDYTYPIRFNQHYMLNQELADEIIDLLSSGVSASTIAKQYKVSVTNISNINHGIIYRRPDITYPIFRAVNSKSRLNASDIEKIIYLLLNTDLNYNNISSELGIGRKTISNINNGMGYIDVIKSLGYTQFPLRDNYMVCSNPCTNISKETVV